MPSAIGAGAAGKAEPWNADAHTEGKIAHAIAQRVDPADHFMTGDDRIADVRQFGVDDVQVGAAHAASAHLHAHLAWSRGRIRSLRQCQRLSGSLKNHGMHELLLAFDPIRERPKKIV